MRNLSLSRDAQNDLQDIYRHGAMQFGLAQADHYSDRILEAFNLISAFPDAHPRAHAHTATRSYIAGAHRILYRAASDHILILRILHTRQLPPGLDSSTTHLAKTACPC